MTESQLLELLAEWRFWGRENQIAPDGDWDTWIALAGRGFGKTEAGAQWVKERVTDGAMSIALIAETNKDLVTVMVPRLLSLYSDKANDKPVATFSPVKIVWPSGAIAMGYNGTEPDQLRGPEFDTAWVDELAKYRKAREVWDMLAFTMRAGDNPRVFVSTTPRAIPVIREILKDERTVITRGSTYDNKAHLPRSFLNKLKKRYEGTRLGRQELHAEVLDDLVGALWVRAEIDEQRVKVAPDLTRIVVAIDPSGTKGEDDEGDSIGIIVAGKGVDGHAYILADYTCKLGPNGWGRRTVAAYKRYRADLVVAEVNYGGAMVENVIRTVDQTVNYKSVTASRGKHIRAEPIAALYTQKRVHHVGEYDELEDQMLMMDATGYVGEGSPDRLDAMVWALTELMLDDDTSWEGTL